MPKKAGHLIKKKVPFEVRAVPPLVRHKGKKSATVFAQAIQEFILLEEMNKAMSKEANPGE